MNKDYGIAFKFRARPELSPETPALDGIKQADRNHHQGEDCMGDRVTRYNPAKDAIREDVLKLIQLPRSEFAVWYERKAYILVGLLEGYENISSIPDLAYQTDTYNMDVNTSFGGHVETLRNALRNLNLIRDRHDEFHGVEAAEVQK